MIPPIPGDGDGADMAREQLVRTTKRAAAFQIALVALAGLAVLISATFTTLNSYRLKGLTERGERQRKALVDLTQVVQAYNEQHAKQAEDSFRALNESQRCAVLKLFTGASFEKVTADDVAACYQPVAPAPPAPSTTTTTRKEKR